MVFSFTDTIETRMIRNDIWILDAEARPKSEKWKKKLNIMIKVKVHVHVHVSFDIIL